MTGKQLIKLLEAGGWERGRKSLHGITFRRPDPDGRVRVTTVPDKRSSLPPGTLNAILGPKQTNLGREGLADLLMRFGVK